VQIRKNFDYFLVGRLNEKCRQIKISPTEKYNTWLKFSFLKKKKFFNPFPAASRAGPNPRSPLSPYCFIASNT
jgi:hypothetical protein